MLKKAQRFVHRMTGDPSYVLGRFLTVRRAYAASQKVVRPRGTDITIASLFEKNGDRRTVAPSGFVISTRTTDDHRDALRKHAWSGDIRLSEEAIANLRAVAHRSPLTFIADAQTFGSAESLDALDDAACADITTATLSAAWQDETVQRIAADPAIVDVVTAYLGYRPRTVMPYFFWSFPSDIPIEKRIERNQTVLFHYDVQGFNFAYISFYLYPTGIDNGAHVLVQGSHRHKSPGHLFGSARLSDADAQAFYGADEIVTVEGDAGTGFFEDTSCFHKALVPTGGRRLMLQFRYL